MLLSAHFSYQWFSQVDAADSSTDPPDIRCRRSSPPYGASNTLRSLVDTSFDHIYRTSENFQRIPASALGFRTGEYLLQMILIFRPIFNNLNTTQLSRHPSLFCLCLLSKFNNMKPRRKPF